MTNNDNHLPRKRSAGQDERPRALRLRGYTGRLRARGHVIADQYAMARRSGFDEVEVTDEIAARQPEDQWLFRADWRAHDYQSRLRGTPAA